jgi:hypothetical protein
MPEAAFSERALVPSKNSVLPLQMACSNKPFGPFRKSGLCNIRNTSEEASEEGCRQEEASEEGCRQEEASEEGCI